MRFKIKPYAPFEWHRYFPILPVRTKCNKLVFFEYVERKAFQVWPHEVYEYRLPQ
jgi:hypothetical protein